MLQFARLRASMVGSAGAFAVDASALSIVNLLVSLFLQNVCVEMSATTGSDG